MVTSTGLLLALTTAVFFATYGLLSRSTAVKSASPLALSVVYGFYASFFCLFILFFEPWKTPALSFWVIVITIIASLLYAIYDASQFFARQHIEASLFSILFQIAPVVTFIGSFFLLGESFSLQKIGGVSLIMIGNLIAVYKHTGQVVSFKGYIFALLTIVSIGLAYVADKSVFNNYSLGTYSILMFLLPAFYIWLFFTIRGGSQGELIRELKHSSWRTPLLALITVVGYYLLLKTFQIMDLSVAIPIVYTATILTVFGGIVILKERDNMLQKIMGGVLVFIGLIILQS